MAELRDAGALGFTDDGKPVVSAGMLRKALQYQRLCGGVIALHEEDPALSGDGVMHEGAVSARLGMAGIPSVSESTMVARDAALARYEDARVHFQHLSCVGVGRGAASGQGRPVPGSRGEVTPHHLTLTDDLVRTLDSRFKMNPPLRTESDRRALVAGAEERRDRLRRHRSRAARPPREGGAVRAGADGHDRARDRVRGALHRAGAAGRARARRRHRADDRRRRAVRPADAADRARRARQPLPGRSRRAVRGRRRRLRQPLGELLLPRPHAARARAADAGRRRASRSGRGCSSEARRRSAPR